MRDLLVPILNAEANVPVCLHPYDSHHKKWLADGKRIGRVAKRAPSQLDTFQPKIFNAAQKEVFLGQLKAFTSSTGLHTKISKGSSAWQLVCTQNEDSQSALNDTVFNKVLKNAPFIIILEGSNAG